MRTGERNLISDVSGLRVGNSSDEVLKSGVTVLLGDDALPASCAVMGGAPGTRETDLLQPDKLVPAVDAIFLSGGSAFGLDAASGIVDGLKQAGRGFQVGSATVPIVPGAILFDLLNGGDKQWSENPYPSLGRAALDAANPAFAIGSVGAGTGALTARLKGGLGSASLVLDNGITVGALVAVNSFGAVTPSGSRHFWAAPFEMNAEFGGLGPDPGAGHVGRLESFKAEPFHPSQNTTLAIVATDANLSKSDLQRVAIASHDGFARAIVPAHTPFDGDIVFSLSTGAMESQAPSIALVEICDAAAHCVARAIARGVFEARSKVGDVFPTWNQ
ncbi:MAG: P1 family peptidase [Pseudomonadota bacterium]